MRGFRCKRMIVFLSQRKMIQDSNVNYLQRENGTLVANITGNDVTLYGQNARRFNITIVIIAQTTIRRTSLHFQFCFV